MFDFFRRRQQEPQAISPTEARELVEQKLRDPSLTTLERGVAAHRGAASAARRPEHPVAAAA
jgi:hypothetical protein